MKCKFKIIKKTLGSNYCQNFSSRLVEIVEIFGIVKIYPNMLLGQA